MHTSTEYRIWRALMLVVPSLCLLFRDSPPSHAEQAQFFISNTLLRTIEKDSRLNLEQAGGVKSRSGRLEPFLYGGGAVQQLDQIRRPQESWAMENSIPGPNLNRWARRARGKAGIASDRRIKKAKQCVT